MTNYTFDEQGYFVIKQYDETKTFSSFLPGMAGLYGVPMWAFYVNRGQGMASFGIQDKNHAITEFFPANQSYQRVATNGFRTFIKCKSSNGVKVIEPFSAYEAIKDKSRTMYIKENELKIKEVDHQIGLETLITYFTLPNENFAALMRKVEIKNSTDQAMNIEVLDGHPAIIPFGVEDAAYKAVGNTLKSWMDVFNQDNHIPYYRVRSSTGDSAEVEEVFKGHFYLSFAEDGMVISPIVDAELVFGQNTSLSYPTHFAKHSLSELENTEQITANKVPCGFSGCTKRLESGETITINTMIGHVSDIEVINGKKDILATSEYFTKKYQEANDLVQDITKGIKTKTGLPLFDAYTKQSYLDNILRGGYPIFLSDNENPFVYYVYSRKHGDLERDYNFFFISPEFFSQGNGNFRDVNQNRRNDNFFSPKVGNYNIKLFMNLIQADGYNPLVVKGASFEIINKQDWSWLSEFISTEKDQQKIVEKLKGTYTPGDLLQYVRENITITTSLDGFLNRAISQSKQHIEADFGEGYWVDHWTYNLDLIENYLKVYPDQLEALLFNDPTYRFYKSPVFVKPRSEKYVLSNGKVRQYGAIEEEAETDSNWLTTKTGNIYETTLFNKLVSLALIKFSTLDPYGMGVEMEGNKPGWNDSMNGLPGLFGSGMSETYELKRLIAFILEQGSAFEKETMLPVELLSFMEQINLNLHADLTDFVYWDLVTTAREQYRDKIRNGLSGVERAFSNQELVNTFKTYNEKVDKGMERAKDLGKGIPPTYFYFEATAYQEIKNEQGEQFVNGKGLPLVAVTAFQVQILPPFLEGPARAMKGIKDRQEAKDLYEKIRKSDIYDQKLGMYKTSSSLEDMSYEIGRSRAFTPGWLERESIFMHMEFKYLLSVLKSGLYEEYFNDLKTALPPFMDPQVYGRSILENSSFIASSVNPNPSLHGQGFVARLSGTTAEFLSMWQMMMVGKEAFYMKNGQLNLTLQPILPEWLFDEENQVEFMFLGKVKVTYHNPKGKHTFGDEGAKVEKYILHKEDKSITIEGSFIEGDYAREIRDDEISRIDVYLK
ncbi:MAG: cellobiose phosphorylase [Bacillota bacterium]|nr:cellobiose phosphorylase [Bacillota bacterium]